MSVILRESCELAFVCTHCNSFKYVIKRPADGFDNQTSVGEGSRSKAGSLLEIWAFYECKQKAIRRRMAFVQL